VSFDWTELVLSFVTLIVSLTFHEAAHAWLAMLGGDRTAYESGQVTLNPVPHMRREPFGMVLLPLITLLMSNGRWCFGYAHAPYDSYWAARHPKRAALMSLAGPLANVFLAAVAFGVLWYVDVPNGNAETAVRTIATKFLLLNLLLALFNLIPLPPLDGAGVVRGLVPATNRAYAAIEAIPYSSLVVFVLLANFIGELFVPVYVTVDRWLPYSTLLPP
jgi:Zn-dependent protease